MKNKYVLLSIDLDRYNTFPSDTVYILHYLIMLDELKLKNTIYKVDQIYFLTMSLNFFISNLKKHALSIKNIMTQQRDKPAMLSESKAK